MRSYHKTKQPQDQSDRLRIAKWKDRIWGPWWSSTELTNPGNSCNLRGVQGPQWWHCECLWFLHWSTLHNYPYKLVHIRYKVFYKTLKAKKKSILTIRYIVIIKHWQCAMSFRFLKVNSPFGLWMWLTAHSLKSLHTQNYLKKKWLHLR